ncbi:MAG TPA: hypothetical protein VF989_05680 [Polyangiaceae bacterium]|jgi:hypothetical protein
MQFTWSPVSASSESPDDGARPLALPEEIWHELGAERRAVYQLGQRVVEALLEPGALPIHDVARAVKSPVGEFVNALQLLSEMDLISVELEDEGPIVTLVAVPDDHVKVRGLDGRSRWVFIARPLEPPERDASELN